MVDGVERMFIQVVINVNPLRVAGVSHAVIADENNVDDICEVPNLQSIVEILSEDVDGL